MQLFIPSSIATRAEEYLSDLIIYYVIYNRRKKPYSKCHPAPLRLLFNTYH
jgi:hypothetical protein